MSNFQYHDDKIGYFVAGSSYSVPDNPAAGAAFRATEITITPQQNRFSPQDQGGTRSMSPDVQGRGWVDFVVKTYLRPSGALGTAPDIGTLLKHTFGTETVNASTSVVYTLLKDMTGLFGSLYSAGTTQHENCYGAIITQLGITWNGNDPMLLTFTGKAKDGGLTIPTTTNGTGSSATALIVDDPYNLQVGSLLSIGGDNNSNAGHLVTALDIGTSTATIASADWADEDAVIPYLPTASYANASGDPLIGIDGSLSFDGGSSTVAHLGGSWTMDTGLDLLNDEYGSDSPTEVIMTGKRGVSFNLDLYLKDGNADLLNKSRKKVAQDLHIIFGDTATKKVTFDHPVVEFGAAGPDSGATGPRRFQLSGKAVTQTAEAEVSATFA